MRTRKSWREKLADAKGKRFLVTDLDRVLFRPAI
jgi:hypothetical protein